MGPRDQVRWLQALGSPRGQPDPAHQCTGSTGFVWVLDPYESLLDLPCGPEDVIANRILSVLVYLRRIQEK